MIAQAERDGLQLLTTEKDLVRIAGDTAVAPLAAAAKALPVRLSFADESRVKRLVLDVVSSSERLPAPARDGAVATPTW